MISYYASRLTVFGISLVHVWVILAIMSIQGFVYLTGPLSLFPPIKIVAAFWGFWGATVFMLFVPSIVFAAIGVIGMPSSWLDGISELFLALEPMNAWWSPRRLLQEMTKVNLQASGTFRNAIDTTLRVLIPFYCAEPNKEYPPNPRNQPYQPERDDEIWIYINGIATPKAIADRNCAKLNKLFHRRVILVHNSTGSIWFDLIQCVVGKIGLLNNSIAVAPRQILKDSIRKHLCHVERRKGGLVRVIRGEIKRVVLVSHSQGTIITGNALAELAQEEDAEFLAKMKSIFEVYNFATCSHEMSNEHVKYMENIGNKGDIVAWLGMFYPFKSLWPDVDGKTIHIKADLDVVQEGRWGHLLNTHYLIPLQREGLYAESRLHAYLKRAQFQPAAIAQAPETAVARVD